MPSGRILGGADKVMRFKAVIFDLDGTLLDTLEDLADSTNAALTDMGFPAHPVDAYRYFVGDGARVLAERALPQDKCNDATIQACHEKTRAEYAKRWDNKTRPYPGIKSMLAELAKRRIKMAVLSNKPHNFTELTVARFLGGFAFDCVLGVQEGIAKKPDAGGALKMAGNLALRPEEFIYVGDTNTDMLTANAAGMYAAGALWGFRTAKELLESGAMALIEKPLDVLVFFDKN
jgi:phosphoglycolate phosphatase